MKTVKFVRVCFRNKIYKLNCKDLKNVSRRIATKTPKLPKYESAITEKTNFQTEEQYTEASPFH